MLKSALFCALLAVPLAAQQPAAGPSPAPAIPPVNTSITVTEHISTESPANITNIGAEQLSDTPGVELDDRLRQVPGFSLFRRTSSEIANPTTQGVSLRGIGSTGASRTLVLFDGVPFNDPFGGWVYWTRFTPEDIDRIEVSRGASTSLFGNLALGGAVDIFPPVPIPNSRHISAGAEAGTQNTYDIWADYTQGFRNFAVSAGGRGFTSDGYYVVPGYARGSVDRPANVRFVNDNVRLDYFRGAQRFYAWVNSVIEERGNGTALTHNSTAIGTLALRYIYTANHDNFELSGFGTSGEFHSDYSSVAASRNFERLVSTQTVPESAYGGSAIYTHSQSRFDLTAGTDVEQDHGVSTDRFSPTSIRAAGGTILEHGEFLQGDLKVGPLRFFAGGRDQFTGQQNHRFFEPSSGVAAAFGRWRLRGSAYRAFRAPTLNELYRQFRVGNTTTLANAQLQPETLLGAEIGADYVTERGAIRITAFRNSLQNLITNVTLSSSANSITRQRENNGNALDRGIEISASERWRNFTGQVGYLFADSRYNTGLRVPQVPKSQGSASVLWSHGGTLASMGVRSYSSQFDDDQNKFLLPGFAVVQLLVRQHLISKLAATLEATNLLDKTFYTGFTPTPTIGDPRILRAGLLWKLN